MKNKIKELLSKTSPKHRTRVIRKNEDMLNWILLSYPAVDLNIAIDAIVKDNSPYCNVCGNPIKSLGKITCSTTCRSKFVAANQELILEKRKQTCIDRYGVSNPAQIAIVQEKRLTSMVQKYGAKVSPKSRVAAKERSGTLNILGRKSLFEKYGVLNPGQLPNHKEKIKNTSIEKYGVAHYTKSQEFIDKVESEKIKRWELVMPSSIEFLNITDDADKQLKFNNPNQLIEFCCHTCRTNDNAPTETIKWRIRNTGTPCKKCGGLSIGSLKQQAITTFIESLGIKIISNFKLMNNKEIDIFCVDYNIGFEFNGLFWHNDLRIDSKYHSNKTIVAHEQGITLIHIFEDEWDHKQSIVESRIKNLLGLSSNKIFARKCSIKEVPKDIELAFLNNNHIQGYARSSMSIGLYYDDILVSVMTFSKPNIAKGQKNIVGHWELLRFCSLLNYNIVGAAGKLFSYFTKTYNPLQVLSFADSRWSTGKLYKKLRFIEHKKTAINYWYINLKEGKRIHRFSLRKNKLDDQSLTEYENRLKQGYLRIWDCGSSKWIWTPQV